MSEELSEILEPSYTAKTRVIGLKPSEMTYVQKPLSFFGKIDFFALLGKAVDKSLTDSQLSLAEVFDLPNQNLNEINDIREADFLVRIVAKLIQEVPDFSKDLYCLALAVPKGEREYVKMLFELPEDEGGLSDDVGIDILDTFIEQNYEVMLDFFSNKILPMFQKLTGTQESDSLKQSKVTQPATPKASKKS